jgi:hypothetical protein
MKSVKRSPKRSPKRRKPRQPRLSVPRTRLELARRKPAPAPQAGVSTNFTIWAKFPFISRKNFYFFKRDCKTIKNLKEPSCSSKNIHYFIRFFNLTVHNFRTKLHHFFKEHQWYGIRFADLASSIPFGDFRGAPIRQ